MQWAVLFHVSSAVNTVTWAVEFTVDCAVQLVVQLAVDCAVQLIVQFTVDCAVDCAVQLLPPPPGRR